MKSSNPVSSEPMFFSGEGAHSNTLKNSTSPSALPRLPAVTASMISWDVETDATPRDSNRNITFNLASSPPHSTLINPLSKAVLNHLDQ